MYNRYIGNTGKVYIIKDAPTGGAGKNIELKQEPAPAEACILPSPDVEFSAKSNRSNMPGFLQGLLPSCFEISDLLIIALLLFLFFESRDEDFLIILGFFAWSVFKER